MAVRAELLDSFAGALVPVGVLDRFKVDGVIARWWNETQYDLKTLVTLGFEGLVQGWAATVRAGLDETEDKTSGDRFDPLSHKLVPRLLPDYLQGVGRCRRAPCRDPGPPRRRYAEGRRGRRRG